MPSEIQGTQQEQTESTKQWQENESHVHGEKNEVTDNTPFELGRTGSSDEKAKERRHPQNKRVRSQVRRVIRSERTTQSLERRQHHHKRHHNKTEEEAEGSH